MSDLMNIESGGLLGLLHNNDGDIKIPEPYERDIFLFDTYIAGTTHIEGMEELEPYIKIGERVDFFREPNNPYDSNAIVVKTQSGVKIGYVPKKDNVVFSRLMDAGKLLFGKISDKSKNGNWVIINMKIYLHE